MIEVIAGIMVALAALAWVLEPLARRPAAAGTDAAGLVRRMRERLTTTCPSCSTPAEPGSAYCPQCGAVLLTRE